MNLPNPALVTQRGARPLPRLALGLLCAAYVLPGVVGRDPWRNADLAAFGQMAAMAAGRTSWWQPQLGAVTGDTAALPHWLGAAFIAVLSPALEADLAARIPFALLLAGALALTWYATFHFARTESAQPVPFAFGGEAHPVDYARAIADGSVLALMAALGLLQLGHETTPELAQLAAIALFLYGLAAAPFRPVQSRAAVLAALPLLCGSGAPAMALVMGAGGLLVCLRSHYASVRPIARWIGAAMLLGIGLAAALGAWRWRANGLALEDLPSIARQWAWFMWPLWPMALWTVWRWRRQLARRHIAAPLVVAGTALIANLAMNGSDRALMLGLPALAVLAAFALPTLRRSAAAAIDWFAMAFFTLGALFIWVMYLAMQTGWPAQPAANVAKLAPDFEPRFSAIGLALALLATLAWVWVVRWRTGRHREALWKSLVLSAGGVALCWLLAMTLWLPVLDHARSPRVWVQRIASHVPAEACVAVPGGTAAHAAALEHFGGWVVDLRGDAWRAGCDTMIAITRSPREHAAPEGFALVAEVRRPAEREERTLVYRRRDAR